MSKLGGTGFVCLVGLGCLLACAGTQTAPTSQVNLAATDEKLEGVNQNFGQPKGQPSQKDLNCNYLDGRRRLFGWIAAGSAILAGSGAAFSASIDDADKNSTGKAALSISFIGAGVIAAIAGWLTVDYGQTARARGCVVVEAPPPSAASAPVSATTAPPMSAATTAASATATAEPTAAPTVASVSSSSSKPTTAKK